MYVEETGQAEARVPPVVDGLEALFGMSLWMMLEGGRMVELGRCDFRAPIDLRVSEDRGNGEKRATGASWRQLP